MKRHLSIVLVLILLMPSIPLGCGASALEKPTDLLLHIGSPIALSDGNLMPVDSNNPGLAPFIHKSRTLVPLRMIAEHFGAVVDYDAGSATAFITFGGKKAAFPVGESYVTLDGVRIDIDTETLLVEGRVFVPLRVICEQILGLQAVYDNSVIYIAEKAELDGKMVEVAKEKIGMFVRATSLYTLKGSFPSMHTLPSPPVPFTGGIVIAPDGGSGGYSSTNIQVEGIDEGDIVKTDGTYIYTIAEDRLRIVKAAVGGGLSLVSSTPIEEDSDSREMYIDENRVIVISYQSEYVPVEPLPSLSKSLDMPIIEPYSTFQGKYFAVLQVFDTTDASNPKLYRSFELQGFELASRKRGDYIYLVTKHEPLYGDTDPRPILSEDGNAFRMPLSSIMTTPAKEFDGILTLSAVNWKDATQPVSYESITGSGYATYMSHDALYIAMPDYRGYDSLNVARFSIDGPNIGYKGSGTVNGGLNDQFGMDAFDGHLRLATTVGWGEKNNLYVLDGNMDVCGSVLGFAPGESIYSARFMGNRGYVVTFRQTDPLFVFDLSDPANPRITGELKVPGFSNYLHPVSENVLMGIGREVVDVIDYDEDGEELLETWQKFAGLKISLFDVSDAGRPREIDVLVIGDYGYSELLYNHKAGMFKANESLLAFPVRLYDGEWYFNEVFSGALLVSWKGDKLSIRAQIPLLEEGLSSCTADRLLYIGDTLYYLQDNLLLRSFDLATLEPLHMLSLAGM